MQQGSLYDWKRNPICDSSALLQWSNGSVSLVGRSEVSERLFAQFEERRRQTAFSKQENGSRLPAIWQAPGAGKTTFLVALPELEHVIAVPFTYNENMNCALEIADTLAPLALRMLFGALSCMGGTVPKECGLKAFEDLRDAVNEQDVKKLPLSPLWIFYTTGTRQDQPVRLNERSSSPLTSRAKPAIKTCVAGQGEAQGGVPGSFSTVTGLAGMEPEEHDGDQSQHIVLRATKLIAARVLPGADRPAGVRAWQSNRAGQLGSLCRRLAATAGNAHTVPQKGRTTRGFGTTRLWLPEAAGSGFIPC